MSYDWIGIGMTVVGASLPAAAAIYKWKGTHDHIDKREFYNFRLRTYRNVLRLRSELREIQRGMPCQCQFGNDSLK